MRIIKESEIRQVPRKGRRLVGISPEHYKRMAKLCFTTAGKLSLAAVAATVIELGLKELEKA